VQFLSYDLARGLHIIAVMAWIAGLVMAPRLYAYVTGASRGGDLETVVLAAAGRLRAIILTPSMILAWLLGLHLFASYVVGDWRRPAMEIVASVPVWFWIKLSVVVLLSGYHGYLVAEGRRMGRGEQRRSQRFWRLLSEAPFIAAIIVVLLATLEPRF